VVTAGINGDAPFHNPRELNAHGSRKDGTERETAQIGLCVCARVCVCVCMCHRERERERERERSILYVKTISAIKITAVGMLR